jgi:lipoprotein-releasing system ATP-binding protein
MSASPVIEARGTGPSGSGKSSLLYRLGLIDVPTSGEVLIEGHATGRLRSEQRAHSSGEARFRLPIPLPAAGVFGARQCADSDEEAAPHPRARAEGSLANDPAVILADARTGNLDTRNSAIVFDIFAGIAEREGRSVVAVTHDLELARRAGRRVHLVDGRLAPVPA